MKKMRKSFFTLKSRNAFELYSKWLFDEIDSCKKQFRKNVADYKAGMIKKFKINDTGLSTLEMLVVADHFMDLPNNSLTIFFAWVEAKQSGNDEHLRNHLKKAEEFLKQIPGAWIPSRPDALKMLFEEDKKEESKTLKGGENGRELLL